METLNNNLEKIRSIWVDFCYPFSDIPINGGKLNVYGITNQYHVVYIFS